MEASRNTAAESTDGSERWLFHYITIQTGHGFGTTRREATGQGYGFITDSFSGSIGSRSPMGYGPGTGFVRGSGPSTSTLTLASAVLAPADDNRF